MMHLSLLLTLYTDHCTNSVRENIAGKYFVTTVSSPAYHWPDQTRHIQSHQHDVHHYHHHQLPSPIHCNLLNSSKATRAMYPVSVRGMCYTYTKKKRKILCLSILKLVHLRHHLLLLLLLLPSLLLFQAQRRLQLQLQVLLLLRSHRVKSYTYTQNKGTTEWNNQRWQTLASSEPWGDGTGGRDKREKHCSYITTLKQPITNYYWVPRSNKHHHNHINYHPTVSFEAFHHLIFGHFI